MPEFELGCRMLLWQDIAIMKQMKKTEAQVNSLKAGAPGKSGACRNSSNFCRVLSTVLRFCFFAERQNVGVCCPCWSICDVFCYVLFHHHFRTIARSWTSHDCFFVRKFSERSIWIHRTTSACKNWRSWAVVTEGQWTYRITFPSYSMTMKGAIISNSSSFGRTLGTERAACFFVHATNPFFGRQNMFFVLLRVPMISADMIWWTQNRFRVVIRSTLRNCFHTDMAWICTTQNDTQARVRYR